MGNFILVALAAAMYPTLLAGAIVLLARAHPERLLAAFLAGGMLISIAAGVIIVFALDGTVSTSNQKSASPTVDLVAGILSIILAVVLWKREHDRRDPRDEAPTRTRTAPRGRSELSGRGQRGRPSGAD